MPPSAAHRGAAKAVAFQREILRRVHAIPGVKSAGFTNHIPLVMKGDVTGVGVEGRDAKNGIQCLSRMAGPGYMSTMGIPLLRGRDIAETDTEGSSYALLINETLARTAWPGQDPLGRRLIFGRQLSVPVVGVVGDIHQAGLDVPPTPEFYVSTLQVPEPPSSLAVQTSVDPASVVPALRRAIWSVDPDQPVIDIATMEEILDREVSGRRLQTTLLGVFSGFALLLAAIGLYGVLAYLVGQQIPEIGIRMALGAAPSQVLCRVAGYGLKLTAIGVGIGFAAALALSRVLSSLLFQVRPTEPATFVAVTLVLLAAAGAACYLPARRAMRVDPLIALREE
jgi:predicted permease